LLLAARGFASYAYGFVEDAKERAELKGDLDLADYERARARALYLKGRDFGVRLLEQEAPNLKQEMKRDPDALKRLLVAEFTDKEDAPALFWTGYAWGSAIGVSRDDVALVADIALATVFVERSVELDETFYNAAGHTFLGVVNSSRGQAVGGDPAKGKQHFERALALTQRKMFLTHVNYAQYYAVQEQNRPLFDALLKEVLDAPEPEPSPVALPNTIAKRRAKRLYSQADSLILPPLPEAPPLPAEAAPAANPAPAAPAAAPATTAPAAPSNAAPAAPKAAPAPKSSAPAPKSSAPAPKSSAPAPTPKPTP
jgi:hypothetical protein